MTTSEILDKLIWTGATGLGSWLLALTLPSVRSFVFYNRVEYDFDYDEPATRGSARPCAWDIQWEDYRLTIDVADISNDKLEGVTFCRNKGLQHSEPVIVTRDSFKPLFEGEIYYKLNSIVRRELPSGKHNYMLRFVFRRRRWAWA